MIMGEYNDGTDVDKWLFDHVKSIKGSNFSVQVILYQTNSIFCQSSQNNTAYFTNVFLSKALVLCQKKSNLLWIFCIKIMQTFLYLEAKVTQN